MLARFQGQGEIDATVPELGPATLRFTAAGNDKTVRLNELKLTAADRPLALSAKGDVQLAELRFNASGQWQSLAWPLTGPAQVESPKGEFAAEGTPKDYRFQLAADLQGPDVPKGRWTLSGQGSDQAVRDVQLSGQTLEGTLQGHRRRRLGTRSQLASDAERRGIKSRRPMERGARQAESAAQKRWRSGKWPSCAPTCCWKN